MRFGRGWLAVSCLVLAGPVLAEDSPQDKSKSAISEGLQMCEMGDHEAGLDSVEKGILILKSANLPIPGPPESLPEYKQCLGIWSRRLENTCMQRAGKEHIETITGLLNRVAKMQNPVDPATRAPIADVLGNALGNCVMRYAMSMAAEAKSDPSGALGPVNELIKIEFFLETLKDKNIQQAAGMAQQALFSGKVQAVKEGLEHGLALCKKKKKAEGLSRVERYLLYLEMIGYDDPGYKTRAMAQSSKFCK